MESPIERTTYVPFGTEWTTDVLGTDQKLRFTGHGRSDCQQWATVLSSSKMRFLIWTVLLVTCIGCGTTMESGGCEGVPGEAFFSGNSVPSPTRLAGLLSNLLRANCDCRIDNELLGSIQVGLPRGIDGPGRIPYSLCLGRLTIQEINLEPRLAPSILLRSDKTGGHFFVQAIWEPKSQRWFLYWPEALDQRIF